MIKIQNKTIANITINNKTVNKIEITKNGAKQTVYSV